MAANPSINKQDAAVKHGLECLYIKVSMDGAPYLRKIDLKTYCNYKELSLALEKMFTYFTIGGEQSLFPVYRFFELCICLSLNYCIMSWYDQFLLEQKQWHAV